MNQDNTSALPETSSAAVTLEVRSGVAWITLNRPDALNTINDDVRRQLPVAIRAADADAEVRVIVLREQGLKVEAAGVAPEVWRDVAYSKPPRGRAVVAGEALLS